MHRRELLRTLSALVVTGCRGKPGPTSTDAAPSVRDERPLRCDVLVVGAGIAGLAAARDLVTAERRVIVLESRDRVGGRIFTDRTWGGPPIDLGASWIHGPKGNAVAALARDLGVVTVATDWEAARITDEKGRVLTATERERIAARLDKVLRQIADDEADDDDGPLDAAIERAAKKLGLDAKARVELAWAAATTLEHEFAGDLSRLSRRHFDEGKADRGGDLLFPKGYDQITNALAKGLDVRLDHRVTRVRHDDDGVSVQAAGRTFRAQRIVVTLPLGVLKAGSVQFEPALPAATRQAIDRIGVGVLDKVYLRFSEPFWPADVQVLGCVTARRGDFAAAVAVHRAAGENVLLCLNAGSFAAELAARSDDAIVAAAVARMRTMFGAGVPLPQSTRVTRWGQDPHALGAYSHMAPGSTPADREALGEPVSGRVFLAGEAVSRDHAASVRGAFESGKRAAARILHP